MDISSKTIAITVTYNPELEILKKQLKSLRNQCKVIIADNASRKDLLKSITEISHSNEDLQIIALDKNLGISRAQNICIEYIINNHPETHFVLLLDHDSIPTMNMVKGLEMAFESLIESGNNPAVVGPLLFDPRDKKFLGFHKTKWGFWLRTHQTDPPIIKCPVINSSGSLISIEVFKKIGLLEEKFFMDHGETEWCFRAANKGYKIFGAANVILEHNMGDDVCEFWFFGKKRMPYRSPVRHYYIVRNSILLQKRSYVPLVWKFWNAVKILFTLYYFGFISKESKEHKHYIWKGICDGVKGITDVSHN